MSNIKALLSERNLPDLLCGAKTPLDFEKRQKQLRRLIAERQFGEIPPRPDHVSVEVTGTLENFACGLAVLRRLKFICEVDGVQFSFPAISAIPKNMGKVPAFVHIGFDQGDGGKYMPTEEIVERGFALFAFYYKDVSSDDGDFNSGIAKHLVKTRRKLTAPGKIALWAWAAMRVMDYVEKLDDEIDLDNVAVIGHSRLGKTALLAGGFDQRFKYVISNNSGCAGAAIERGKRGETYHRISEVFPYWFCPAFNRNAANGTPMPFDQHYLLSLSVPRHIIIGSAEEDIWADPTAELLGAASLDEAYALYGKRGLDYDGDTPKARTVIDGDGVTYYIRKGTHFLSRHDWNTYMDIIEECVKKQK